MLKDWRQAVRTPPAYRVGNSMVRMQFRYVIAILLCMFLAIVVWYKTSVSKMETNNYEILDTPSSYFEKNYYKQRMYNATYPVTKPKLGYDNNIYLNIAVVADMDTNSKSKMESNTWESYYLKGQLIYNSVTSSINVNWNKEHLILKSTYGHKGRGMELSELVTFDGHILTFDDRSGIVYKILNNKPVAWILLTDGDGDINKGFKSEWATVKDEYLYVGSMGKEWTTPYGEYVNDYPLWVKKINRFGSIEHLNWEENYKSIRNCCSIGIKFPGYMLHESAMWSNVHKKWFFLPRRLSHSSYNEEFDETQGTNVLISCDENFTNFRLVMVGEVIPTHGFSSFKFIPGSNDEIIVALKTLEHKGRTATYIMAFNINGKILLGETKIDDMKYEGFEFV